MTNWFTRKITGIFNYYSRYSGAGCMNDYSLYKSDIEQKIDNLDKKIYVNFYEEWEKIKKYITEKDNELKDCYRNGHITGTLIEDDNIKNFMNRCSKNRQCNNPSRQVQRTVSSNPKTKGSCKKPNNCKEPTAPKETKPNPKTTSPEVISRTGSSGRQNSDDQGQSHVNIPGSRAVSLNSQTQTIVGHSDPSVVADTNVPEQRDNTNSGVSGQTETQTQSESASALKKENILDPHPRKDSSQGISDGGSPSIGNFPLKVLETNKHQCGPHGSKNLSGKALDEHATAVESVEDKTTIYNNCFKTSCAENLAEGTPSRGENVDGHSTQAVTNSLGTDVTSVVSRDSVSVDIKSANLDQVTPVLVRANNRDTHHVTLGSQSPCDGDSCVLYDQSKAARVKTTEAKSPDSDDTVEDTLTEEDVSTETAQKGKDDPKVQQQGLKEREPEPKLQDKLGKVDHLTLIRTPQNRGGYSSPPQCSIISHESSSAGSAPISEDNSEKNTLSEQIGFGLDMGAKDPSTIGNGIELQEPSLNEYLIQYKEYIIMALIPLIVILLLIILLKYTPLRMLFTKKKGEKRKQMNEKLQRVLVEPSNAREERNIQFAYSAFEYSK